MSFTIHPKNIEGEIRGKSSNVAWASIQMVRTAFHFVSIILSISSFCFSQSNFLLWIPHFNSLFTQLFNKAQKSGGGLNGRHEHEVLTIMDADTCFAEDYFTAGKTFTLFFIAFISFIFININHQSICNYIVHCLLILNHDSPSRISLLRSCA